MTSSCIAQIARSVQFYYGDKNVYTLVYGNITWNVVPTFAQSETSKTEKYLGVQIELKSDHTTSRLWSCETEIELTLKPKFSNEVIKQSLNFFFNFKSTILNFEKLMLFDSSLNPAYLHVTCDTVIRLKSTVGFQEIPITDFSVPTNTDSEIVLHGRGFKLYVDKLPLLCFSSVFREILSKCDNKNLNELEIDEEDMFGLVKVLQLLYQQKPKLFWKTAERVLQVARKYDIESIVSNIEDYLILAQDIKREQKRYLANKFNLAKLQEECPLLEGESEPSRRRCRCGRHFFIACR